MAETKTVAKPTSSTMKELYQGDKVSWEYITIPDENALGERHASIGLNSENFEPGQTYHVPAKVAETVRERLKVYAKSCVRVLSPKRDFGAENAVAVGSANARGNSASATELTQMQ